MFFVASDQASPAPKTQLSNPREKDAVNAAAGKAKTLAETTRVFLIPSAPPRGTAQYRPYPV